MERRRVWLFILLLFVLATGTCVRFIHHFLVPAHCLDFACYYDVTRALVEGLNPYDAGNLEIVRGDPPIVLPFQAVMMIPWTLLPHDISTQIYFIINWISAIGVFTMLWSRYMPKAMGGTKTSLARSPLFVLALLLFLNTAPLTAALGLRQLSLPVSWLLLVALFSDSSIVSGLSLGVASALKLSMTPLFGLLLLFRGQWKTCFIATGVFIIAALVPMLFGHALLPLYRNYLTIHETMMESWNSYSGSNGFSVISAGLFRPEALNFMTVLFCYAIYALSVRQNRKNRDVDGVTLLLLICCTMMVVYHRSYDSGILVTLIIIFMLRAWLAKAWLHALVCSAFVLYFLIPWRMLIWIAKPVGRWMDGNQWIWLTSHFDGSTHLVPFAAIVMLGLMIYAAGLLFYKSVGTNKSAFIEDF